MRLPALIVFVLLASPLSAQTASSAISAWAGISFPPGEEVRGAAAVRAIDSRFTPDATGNFVVRLGSGRPRRLVACTLDHPGFVVSQITDNGYLRLHQAGSAPRHVLWDQFHEAQQVRVWTNDRHVPGVVALPNGHFARQHRGDTLVANVDQLWVDVGARSRAEVESMGIRILDPVERDVAGWEYAGGVAAPDVGNRAACAAIVSAARSTPAQGETVFALTSERSFGWLGLGAVISANGPFDEVTVVTSSSRFEEPVRRIKLPRPNNLAGFFTDSINAIAVRTRFSGTLVETISEPDAQALLAAVSEVAGVTAKGWAGNGGSTFLPRDVAVDASLTALANRLRSLAELPGIPGHEWRVREAIRDALPVWARDLARVDSAGNLIVVAGPARDTIAFVAHMDEVSWIVSKILADGTVELTGLGGVIPSAWEGQAALLHFDRSGTGPAPASLRGVFIPRETATLRRPATVRAWFGLDSAALVGRGVTLGSGVTMVKRGQRLGATRFTARSLDDRAGSTALLEAVRTIDPATLTHAVIFSWSVKEETGLEGARVIARTFGRNVRRVYAVDTFVSSDTPLEAQTFAYTPLGNGAVLRGADDGLAVTLADRNRIINLARARGVKMQVGTTQGSSDAVPFFVYGAPGMGLSWPGRYSHSPAEVLDLRDLAELTKLIRAIALAPAQ